MLNFIAVCYLSQTNMREHREEHTNTHSSSLSGAAAAALRLTSSAALFVLRVWSTTQCLARILKLYGPKTFFFSLFKEKKQKNHKYIKGVYVLNSHRQG